MAEESVRIEIAFAGGPILGATVTAASADALERAGAASASGTLQLDSDDGRITVVLDRIAYVKRFARESRVGFGL
ncbi:MAG: hypothetical protein FJW96_07760 [Actinobacteria bacterium]|nr:hypothetical protein [Actinomycetota bacterium]